jgi:hypothetical protein
VTLANLERAPELTPAMREYSFAQRQGFPGTFVDFKRIRRATPPNERTD